MADRGPAARLHGERHTAAGPSVSESESLYADLKRSIHLEFGVKGQIVYCSIARAGQRDRRVATDRLVVTLRELQDGTSAPKV
jgi:hypothetical protein